MTFTHVFGPAGIGASPERVRDPNPLLRSQLEVLPRIPTVGCAETAALFDDPFHGQSLSDEGESGKAERQSLELLIEPAGTSAHSRVARKYMLVFQAAA
jgi:hypothetical protein